MITGFHDEELRSALHRLGFEAVERLSSDEIHRRYFWGRGDGLTMLDHVLLVCARVFQSDRLALAVLAPWDALHFVEGDPNLLDVGSIFFEP